MSSPASTPAVRPIERVSWALYDCANSAYSTLSITLLTIYLQKVVLPGGRGAVAWAWGISASMFAAAILSPVVGALADARRNKRAWLAATALSGAGTAMLMAAVPPTWPWLVVALFVWTALMFELSLGFYNGFLPELSDERTMNRMSAWGFAAGYIGGAAALVLALALAKWAGGAGWSGAAQLRLGLLVMGFWWFVFSLPALLVLRDRGERTAARQPLSQAVAQAFREVGHTLRRIRRYSMLALFLLAFLFYNDGIQTVISQSSTFAIEELAFEKEDLVALILLIQLVALPGAVAVAFLADRIGQKPTLIGCLAVWIALVVGAYFITTQTQFWVLGVVLALVMGGTQSVSRAVMGIMTPPSRTAEFFGFFNLSGKATSFLGTFVFGLCMIVFKDARLALTSLLVFFLLGWGLVLYVDIGRGRRQAMETETP